MTVKKAFFPFLLLLVGLFGVLSPSLFPSPHRATAETLWPLEFTQEFYSFGKVPQNDTIESCVTLVNNSDQSLTIRNCRTTCRCTVPVTDLTGLRIGPNKRLDIPVRITTGDVEVVATASLLVIAEDENRRSLAADCTVLADVWPDFTISEKLVEFGQVSISDAGVQKQVFLTPDRMTAVKVLECTCTSKFFSAHTVTDGRGQVVVTIKTTPDSSATPRSGVSGIVKLRTNSERHPEVELFVTALFESPLSTSVSGIVFVRSNQGTWKQDFRVSTASEVDFEIVDVICSCSGIQFEKPLGFSKNQKIVAQLSESSSNDSYSGKATLVVRRKKEPETIQFSIPVFVIANGDH